MDHFTHLNSIERKEIIPSYTAQMIHSENMTLIYWDILAGYSLPEHHHPHEQVVSLLEGEFELILNGQKRQLTTAAIAVIPSNATHSGRAITNCKILDVFHPVRQDYQIINPT